MLIQQTEQTEQLKKKTQKEQVNITPVLSS